MTCTRDDDGGVLTHVFDADSATYLHSTFVPGHKDEEWYVSAIRNGYAYATCDWMGVDGSPRIERYKVNPAIYKK